ncbi:glycosyl transferase family 2 [Enemella dayhoffiae]|uniref:4,4'-diaponeurosporenoate glycosyltransferase n=1 Tax=Enemella dayhoffiae TaxID=2016507 RepID=A0A255H0N3_9ACTN|nr:glycosyltransferase [Enemella dayhoffiae]OYO21257.1 glycosyl transferase family 2 [Enemella dayhoffiae]
MQVSEIVVVVPAHDEEELIGYCLAALRRAVDAVGVPVRVRVVLDDCRDATARLLPTWVEPVLCSVRNVGRARALGFTGLRTHPRAWFATTDADSEVPIDWLLAQLDSGRDHDVFVGTVRVTDWHRRAGGTADRYAANYHPVVGHEHVHGANLGISARAYHRLGGFEPRSLREDVALVAAAEKVGLSIDRSAAAPVVTSARRSARTPGGFAATLDRLEAQLGVGELL